MSNGRIFFLRYLSIIKKLERGPASFKEINNYLRSESEFYGDNLCISKRTFQRDLNDIHSLFDIYIKSNPLQKKYSIIYSGTSAEMSKRLLEAFEIYHTLKSAEHFSKFILFEQRKPQGMEHFREIFSAIKNHLVITFTYENYWEDTITQRTVEPYTLKEFKGRWYVLGRDKKDEVIKTFALDRISKLSVSKKQFSVPENFNHEEMFQHCFGIICPDDEQPEEIILSFDPIQGKYIKSFPLHQSQQIIKDDEKELRIKLKLYITFDFLMEILSYGDLVKVISPAKLRKEIRKVYSKALSQY
jgi:predicted DNA-binding transcriptional regulator YafY